MPSFCTRCGSPTEPGDAFCPNCGRELAAAPAEGTAALPVTAAVPEFIPLPSQPVAQKQKRRRKPKPKPWFRKKRFMLPLVFLMLLGITGVVGSWYLNNQFRDFQALSTPEPDSPAAIALADSVQATPAVTPVPKNSITMLLMGVDARDGEAIDIGVRPDSIGVLHINPEAQTCRLISIPRDTRTDLPGYGLSKVNHALAVGGIPYEILVVQNLLGIEIDHYALVDFAGVVGVIDALGGVDVVNTTQFSIEGYTFPVGSQHLNGAQALAYSRFRSDSEGDFGRQRRQQDVIRAMVEKANGLDAARALPSILGGVDGHFRTDLTITSMIGTANKYRDYCTADRVENDGLKGTVSNAYDELYGQELSFVHVSDDEIDTKVKWLLGED